MSGHDEHSAESYFSSAVEKLNALMEAAQTGAIIPIRLPGQIEDILLDVQAAQKAHTAQASKPSANVPDGMDEYMAEEAHFIGHAVHELRTPMTSIRGYSDMLGAMGELSDMQKQFLDVIKVNTKRMEGLLADVSYINKIRKGTLKISAKMDMYKNLAMRLEKDFQPLAEELGRDLIVETASGLPFLNIDGDLFTVAIGKLIENGLRYTPAEGGQVRIMAKADGSDLLITVEDNGIGMSDEEIAQLGTIYFRSDRDEVREYKGSGLGIPIAFGMVEMMGGTIQVESTLDEGTRFTVRMPGIS